MSKDSFDTAKLLESQQSAASWLQQARVRDSFRGYQNLLAIAKSGITVDLLEIMLGQLRAILPNLSDPDMALNNLERFLSATRSPLSFATLCERDTETLPNLLVVFSNSQFLSDVMIRRPAVFDEMHTSQGNPLSLALLCSDLESELDAVQDDQNAAKLVNAFKRRHLARIAFGDLIRGQTMQTVTRQISYLAEAICRAALGRVSRELETRFGTPRDAKGNPARFVVLALGKLGGSELNYSSDIDLIFVYDQDGQTDGKPADGSPGKSVENVEYFDRLAKRLVQWLTQTTPNGAAYRVDLRLRPEGSQGPTVLSGNATLRYYDVSGRTWERQAMVKARPIAGDLDFGREFLERLSSWIYRSYLSQAEISGIKSLKRQIERRASREGNDHLEVKTGHGGIRDIEFVIQFLQLLMGADAPQVRTGNTIDGIVRLEAAGGISNQEQIILGRNYVFLRKIEHRLQIMFDSQTHRIPNSVEEQQKLAVRLGYENRKTADAETTAATQFMSDLAGVTALNRRILDHLLHNTVGDEDQAAPEIDLVLTPEPDEEMIESALGKYGFENPKRTYHLLMELATERLPFLSKRRCRHFLATITPKLLSQVSETPDPEQALAILSRVSESLGGKAALWELLNNSQPSLELYVRLCAACPYLTGLLTSNPGMLDELVDSLLLERLPAQGELRHDLYRLCGQAEDIEPIVASFKHLQHLRVGVRDIVGKETIRSTTRTLSDIAEACLNRIADSEIARTQRKFGTPTSAATGKPAEFVVLAVGKMGGQEPNYHSDLDVIFLFDQTGSTVAPAGVEATSNDHFFAEAGQRIIKAISKPGRYGALYPTDARLRPTGKSGKLAVSFEAFAAYFRSGSGQVWERLALCKARPIYGSPDARRAAAELLKQVITCVPWQSEHATSIFNMRLQMEENASKLNLKRGPGGTVDLEFTIQLLQLRHAAQHPQVLAPGFWNAVEKLTNAELLSPNRAEWINEAYTFLRSIEARIRLINCEKRHDFPTDLEAEKLAFLMRDDVEALRERCVRTMQKNRALLKEIVSELAP